MPADSSYPLPAVPNSVDLSGWKQVDSSVHRLNRLPGEKA